jgi:hypothetical protein
MVFMAAVLDRVQNVHKISVDGGLTWATHASSLADRRAWTSPSDTTSGQTTTGSMETSMVRIYDKAVTNEERLSWLAATPRG